MVVGGGGAAVRREECEGVEWDGERGKPDVANGRSVGGANTCRSQLDAGGYWRETGRVGVWVGCVGRGGGEPLRRKECCGVQLDGAAGDGGTNSVNFERGCYQLLTEC